MVSATDLKIGCTTKPLTEWLADKRGENLIGKNAGYNAAQIAEYGEYVELAAKLYMPKEQPQPTPSAPAITEQAEPGKDRAVECNGECHGQYNGSCNAE